VESAVAPSRQKSRYWPLGHAPVVHKMQVAFMVGPSPHASQYWPPGHAFLVIFVVSTRRYVCT